MAPTLQATHLLQRLRSYYYGAGAEQLPPISQTVAAVGSIAFTVLYVLPFYLSKRTRPSPTINRDLPIVIRARIQSVTLSCLICTGVTLYILKTYAHANPHESLRLMGIYPFNVPAILSVLRLVATLFAGPLYESLLVDGAWRSLVTLRALKVLTTPTGFRTIIASPATEEWLFRSLLCTLALLSHTPPSHIVFYTPLYFGIAHIHHLYEFRLTNPTVPWTGALLRSLFQFTYTTVFGWFATFVLLRTGTVWAAIAAHALCNCLGFPRVWGRVGSDSNDDEDDGYFGDGTVADTTVGLDGPLHPNGNGVEMKEKVESPRIVTRSRANTLGGVRKPRRRSILWTVVYYALLVAGAYGFYRDLGFLTAGEGALAKFD